MKIKFLLVAMVAVCMSSCGSKQAITPASTGFQKVVQPCTGADAKTNGEYFRANASATSFNDQMAKDKALTAARQQLASSIQTTVKSLTDRYTSSYEVDQQEEYRGRYQNLTREVVNQQLSGLAITCEELLQNAEGMYKYYVAIQLSGDEIAKGVANRVQNDEKLRTDFEYERFKGDFEKEMKAFGKNQ